ncbi:HIT family protein [Terrabacter terrigena]|uniref:HIT family protein n=1 Tax=Terrabacter terrigena TaxID=574718 RepID=A0ABW3N2Z2_9MICO
MRIAPAVAPRRDVRDGGHAAWQPVAMDCVFCSIVAADLPSDLVLDEPDFVGFLDRRPVFKGHVLLVPRVHVDTLLDLPDDLHAGLLGAARRLAAAAVAGLGAQGTFVAMNNVVSQSVPHLHVHVVPRTRGDGLRGFFWPRTTYASEEESAAYAARLAAALEPAA